MKIDLFPLSKHTEEIDKKTVLYLFYFQTANVIRFIEAIGFSYPCWFLQTRV